jgi:hypothetical protein
MNMKKLEILLVGSGLLAGCAKSGRDSAILPPVPAGAQAMTLAGRPLAAAAPAPAVLDKYDAAAYGLGNRRFVNGDAEGAKRTFSRILEGPSWASFGHIAAEAAMTPDVRH